MFKVLLNICIATIIRVKNYFCRILNVVTNVCSHSAF